MPIPHCGSTLRARSLSLLLSYAITISLLAPFAIRKVEAATPAVSAAPTIANTRSATQTSGNNAQLATSSGVQGTALNVQGERYRVSPPAPPSGRPLSNIPNLDEIRNRRHQPPHAPAPVPSTRCAPRLRGCTHPRGAPAGPPGDPLVNSAVSEQTPSLPAGLIAANAGDGFPFIESLLGVNHGSVSDSPFKIKLAERMAASLPSFLAPLLQSSSTENVVWTNMQGVTASGNTLTKTAPTGWGNAGAVSTKSIVSGDGYMEFTATGQTTESRIAGLSRGDSSQNWDDVDFGIDLAGNGQVYACESGVCTAALGPYVNGETYRVAIEGGVVRYRRNGTLIYTSTRTPTYPLLVDCALSNNNGTLNNAVVSGLFSTQPTMENVVWTKLLGASASGNNLTKTDLSSIWGNSGASSTRAIASGDGYLEFTAPTNTVARMVGLSNGDGSYNWDDVDFGLDPANDGYVYVCEAGPPCVNVGPYLPNDRFRVAVESGVVKYYKGATLLYTSTKVPTYPLLVDSALYNTGVEVRDAVIYGTLQPAESNAPAVDFSTPRVDPVNRTGTGGEDLLSGNYNWSLPVVSLPGRAGLDLGLSLSYNSLVWTRSGSYIAYDADHGFPSPGFRLGFPVIQPLFTNTQTGKPSYLLITPSGARVELRQTSDTTIYESADSSYLRFDTGQMLLWTPDGTQLFYQFKGDAYQCTRIQDRNGNLITIGYFNDNSGRIQTITDTLERTLTFNYVNGYPTTITQQRTLQGQPPAEPTVLVSFGYDSNYSFHANFQVGGGNNSQLMMIGVQNNTPFPVLTMVGLEDGSYYKFTYSTWGQVSKITRYGSDSDPAQDNHALSYVSYNLANDATARTDCPRFTERRDWAENWNGGAEAVTEFSIALNSGVGAVTLPKVIYTTPPGIPSTSVTVMNKEFFGTGVQKGLTTKVETYADNVLVRTSETSWTQDKQPGDTEYTYQVNPRPTESKVSDTEGNVRRTTVDYDSYAAYGLPHVVREYAPNGSGWTLLRETYTEYKMDAAYLDKRIIGLVTERRIVEGQADKAKTVYAYDGAGEQLAPTMVNSTPVNAAQHEQSYHAGLIIRGNLTSVSRYDVNVTGNPALTTQMGYDTDGSLIFSRDPEGHKIEISYADSFSDNVNRNTFAYPTSVKDPDNYQSVARYDYYTGAVTYRRDPKGAEYLTTYDAAGRVDRTSNSVNGAFRQYAYGSNYVVTWTSVQSMTQTAYAISVFDGAGRVIKTAQDAPVAGVGENRYSGKHITYDVMGRVEFESNPTEMGPGWVAAGDDILAGNEGGWRYAQQTYDWKGRPRLRINTDGTTRYATYAGCGCAGGEAVTSRDEVGRTRKSYADALGRVVRVEEFGRNQSQQLFVYRTTTMRYNALDQVTRKRQYAGEAPATEPEGEAGNYQTTTFQYDGYGRLWKKQLPVQTSPTVYLYRADDMLESVKDARGVKTLFTYNARHLIKKVSFDLSEVSTGQNVRPTADVTFDYDEAGNRIAMGDGSGSTTYEYDALSRLHVETKHFNGLTGSFPITYEYTLSGQLQKLTATGNDINYSYDTVGRLTSVTGSGFDDVTSFITELRYRAWGAPKYIKYGNNRELSIDYNRSLQARSSSLTLNGGATESSTYDFYADGRVKSVLTGLPDGTHLPEQKFMYDQVGRLTDFYSVDHSSSMYYDSWARHYEHDVWDNLTSHKAELLANDPNNSETEYWYKRATFNYTGMRMTSTSNYAVGTITTSNQYNYDADGRLLADGVNSHTFDAAGNMESNHEAYNRYKYLVDGDGLQVKEDWQRNADPHADQYLLRS
ncbi:MAG TPA: hypothetical protein VF553_16030, partial [Pyrinomonadaceae bacterium]